MDRRLFLRVAAPAVLIAALLIGACWIGSQGVEQLHANLSRVLSHNAASTTAAQEMVIVLRQLRFHSFLQAIDSSPARAGMVDEDHRAFEVALRHAQLAAASDVERNLLRTIDAGYTQYRLDLDRPGKRPIPTDPADLLRWADTHPVRPLVTPCQDLLEVNRVEMARIAEESMAVNERTRRVMILLGVVGPVAGLVGGVGIARGLSRSIARLSVRVHDAHAQMDRLAGSVRLTAGGDLRHLDEQLRLVVGRVREMVEQLQRQQADMLRAEQLAAVGQLAAGVAHEVRNPLTAIKLLTGMALRPNSTGLTADDLQVIHREVVRLERVAQGLLDFARLPDADCQPSDFREVVEQAVDLVRGRVEQQGVTLAVQTPNEPVPARIDRGQIGSLTVNLLLNALDAMPTGGRLGVEILAPPGEVRLVVRDSGPGITPAVADRLFTPFVTTKPTGTGLGLSVCQRVAKGHGGSVSGENQPGGGACFTLRLPADIGEAGHGDALGRG